MDVFWTLPPVSRTITALALLVSGLGYAGIMNLSTYVFYMPFIFTTKAWPQLWRLFTAFLITKPKFAILMDPYFLYQYGSLLERESSRFTQPGDFFMYTAFVSAVIVPLAGIGLQYYTFLPALSMAYAYTFAQDNPTRQASFFVVQFESKYLPFALLFLALVVDGPNAAAAQLTGLIAAHLYDFLTRIWPTFGGGKNYMFTPQTVKRWFGAAPGAVQNRGYGTAVQGRGRVAGTGAGAPDPASGRSTGTNWREVGPGRRLGGE